MEGRWPVSVATAGVCSNSLWNVAGRAGRGRAGRGEQWSLVTGAERWVAVDTGTGTRGQGTGEPGGDEEARRNGNWRL